MMSDDVVVIAMTGAFVGGEKWTKSQMASNWDKGKSTVWWWLQDFN